MQMRLGGIAGVAEVAEHVAGVNCVADFHFERAGAQMRVGGEVSVAQVLDDVIARERIGRDRYRELSAFRNVLGDAVLRLDDSSGRYRENLLVPRVIADVLVLVALKRIAVVTKLDPIDRVALADVRLSVHGEDTAAMRRGVGRSIFRGPVFPAERGLDRDRNGGNYCDGVRV